MFRDDRPILHAREDSLDRMDLARNIARAIADISQDSSIVIGVAGPWGSGKTSVINLVCEELRQLAAKSEENGGCVVVPYGPWKFTASTDLLESFFSTLKRSLGEQKLSIGLSSRDADRLISDLDVYLGLLKPGVLKATASFFHRRAQESLTLDRLKERIERVLRAHEAKVLVVVDDLDRLTSEQIRDVFRLIAAVADFNGVNYLLAYDRDVVVEVLSGVQGLRGDRYLEKIVQVQIDIPEPSPSTIETLFFDSFSNALAEYEETRLDTNQRLAALSRIAGRNLLSVRNLRRLENAFRFKLSALKGKVDPVDMAALELLKVISAAAFVWLRNNRIALCLDGPMEQRIGLVSADDAAGVRNRCRDDLRGDSRSVSCCLDILDLVFFGSLNRYGERGETRGSVHEEKRILDIDFFETYLMTELDRGRDAAEVITAMVGHGEWGNLERYIKRNKICGKYDEVASVCDTLVSRLNPMQLRKMTGVLARCLSGVGVNGADASEGVRMATVLDNTIDALGLVDGSEFALSLFSRINEFQVVSLSEFVIRRNCAFGLIGYQKEHYQELIFYPTLEKINKIFSRAVAAVAYSANSASLAGICEALRLWERISPDHFRRELGRMTDLSRKLQLLSEGFASPRYTARRSDVITSYYVEVEAKEYLSEAELDDLKEMNWQDDESRDLSESQCIKKRALLEGLRKSVAGDFDGIVWLNDIRARDAQV